jgi:hypothetical protein
MPFPADMYVDYIRVYEWNGQGSVHLGPPAFEQGVFGLFTDTTPVNGELVPEVSGEIYVWEGTLIDGSIAPYEGENVLSWQTAGLGWFGAGIMSAQPLNLFDFGDGHIEFRINIPAHVSFQIGIIDTWGNQSYVDFPAHQTAYGLVRDGQWGQASIPVADIRGTAMDLRMLSYAFVILEVNGTACEFALDDVYWDSGSVASAGEEVPGSRFAIGPNVPNPFNASTDIRFELPAGGIYELVITDVAGRRVRTFAGVGNGGLNTVHWDGRDDTGRLVSSGTYFYRLAGEDGAGTGKMMLVK